MKTNFKAVSLLLIICLLSISVVSATEDVQTDIQSIDDVDDAVTMDYTDQTLSDDAPANTQTPLDLNTLIGGATAGDTIKLESDYEIEKVIAIDKEVTIDGQGHTINAKESDRIFVVRDPNVIFKNIIFKEGYKDSGGAILGMDSNKSGVSLTIINCTFINNKATHGGAIYTTASGNTIINCTFDSNTAITQSGGAIIINGNDNTIINNTFKNNMANNNGGAIYLENGNGSQIENNVFIKNSAKNGGAITLYQTGFFILNNNIFTDNTATNLGGAIRITLDNSNTTTTISGNKFKNNNASSSGALHIIGGNIEISKNMFDNNRATQGSAGSIQFNGNAVKILNNNFTNTNAETYGGAIVVKNSSSMIIQSNNFTNAKATNGGAIHVATGEATIDSNNFTKCSAINRGGAIRSDTTVKITGNTFKDNTATDKGSDIYIYPSNGDNSQVKNNDFETYTSNSLITYGNVVIQDNKGFEYIFAGLQAKINLAQNGEEVNLDSDYTRGDFAENSVNIKNSITINGNNHVLDGEQSGRILNILCSNVTLKNIIFKNGEISDFGAAVCSKEGGALTIINCTFINNKATRGGAIYSKSNENTIINCTFDNNTATHGGAININASDNIIADNTFKNNKATNNGGAIYLENGNENQISNNELTKNSAYNGGAIYLYQTEFSTLKNNLFTNNVATNIGGAVRINMDNSNSKTTISENNFKNNTSPNTGALHIVGGNAEVNANEFDNNKATQGSAGSIHFNGNSVQILNNNITNTNAKTNGGAIVIKNSTSMTIKSNNIANAKAATGGAIHIETGKATIDSNNFTQCSATAKGGAIKADTTVTITGNNFKDNNADDKGSDIFIYPNNGDNSQVKNNDFKTYTSNSLITYGNVAIQDNKGFENIFAGLQAKINLAQNGEEVNLDSDYTRGDFAKSSVYIEKSITLNGNNHVLDGEQSGRILSVFSTSVTLKNIIFQNGKMSDVGAAVWSEDGSLTIINCTFINNQAAYGGAFYAPVGGNTIINCTFESNTATQSGGAININKNKNTIINNTFKSNIANINNGGAIVITGDNDGKNIIKGNTFEGNKAKGTSNADGGALYIDKGNGNQIEDNVFIKNSARIGGAISLYEIGYFTLNRNTFTDNVAYYIGGAVRISIANSKTKTTISKNKFENNNAPNTGALHIDGSNVEISSNEFDNNKATQGYAGSIQFNGNTLKILNNNITNTSAKTNGGAIVIKTGTSMTIKSNNIANAISENGGAIHIESGKATIDTNNFTQCSATNKGGAIKADTTVTITGNTFKDNTATGKGSDVYIYKGAGSQVKNNDFVTYTVNSLKNDDGRIVTQDNKGFKETLTISTLNKNYAYTTTVKYLTVVLKNSNGNGISNKKLTITLNGKEYTGTTGADGKLKVKINVKAIKKYTCTVKFAGDETNFASTYSFKLSVNKAATKITSPAKTFKKSKVKKVVITLKSGSKVLAKKKVKITIKGRTYSGTTNSKGKATIKIKITKKGSFKGTLRYAGNSIYKASKGTVKIKIK